MKSLFIGLALGALLGIGVSAAARSPAPPTAANNGCIPCSDHHPCTNPLTVCTVVGPGTSCCLGYAG